MSEKSTGKKSSRWFMGCMVVLCIGIIVGAVLYYFVSDVIFAVKDYEASKKIVASKFGAIKDYCPPYDGPIPAARVTLFMEIRDSLTPTINDLDQAFAVLLNHGHEQQTKKKESALDKMRYIKSSINFPSLSVKFLGTRNEVLYRADMAPGEYGYIYILAYYSYLKKSPTDGPDLLKLQSVAKKETETQDAKNESAKNGSAKNGRERTRFEEESQRLSLSRIHTLILPMLRCQLSRLQTTDTESNSAWKHILETEIAALEANPERIPWADGLPDMLEESFAAYKERLAASYNKTVNFKECDLH